MAEDEAIALARALRLLTPSQKDRVRAVIAQFQLPHTFTRDQNSDLVTDGVLQHLGNALRLHHAFSRQALSKDRFEFAFERTLILGNVPASLAGSRTNRGHDITIAGVPVGLKTEAAANIKADLIHVSKWMELGKGEWNLPKLRDSFFDHMRSYERIFTLRCLSSKAPHYFYELVEIPKALLLEAANCKFEVMKRSPQKPKPGYGYVYDTQKKLKYSLYFDGGTERKLQIRSLSKELCKVHATWAFESTPLG